MIKNFLPLLFTGRDRPYPSIGLFQAKATKQNVMGLALRMNPELLKNSDSGDLS
jgi:hypothetical protein